MRIVIVGLGEFVIELLDAITACRRAGQDIEVEGIVEDDRSRWDKVPAEQPILGGIDWFDAAPSRRELCVIGGWGLPAPAWSWWPDVGVAFWPLFSGGRLCVDGCW